MSSVRERATAPTASLTLGRSSSSIRAIHRPSNLSECQRSIALRSRSLRDLSWECKGERINAPTACGVIDSGPVGTRRSVQTNVIRTSSRRPRPMAHGWAAVHERLVHTMGRLPNDASVPRPLASVARSELAPHAHGVL
ncbi:hypothetical protein AG1IA_00773 [Rhizoctonia solani AG-1 IA]|uniref:Uncharacterized protein n=1 Tax=Thanatephorus cucumeris (strain AG1-IA) TaxID=983506 RepID=L8X7Z1_THACA|nr:hypothetical protein AG1IA_00773 [Rhizoctonia solani AG-1 IA]